MVGVNLDPGPRLRDSVEDLFVVECEAGVLADLQRVLRDLAHAGRQHVAEAHQCNRMPFGT